MKRLTVALLLALSISVSTSAQKVRIGAYVPEESGIPGAARDFLETRLMAATTQAGMGASDFTQFFISVKGLEVEKYIVPGAPTKYKSFTELNFYVIDAFSKRVFDKETINVEAIGNSPEKAYIQAVRNITSSNAKLQNLLASANTKIMEYYNKFGSNIIAEAKSIAKAGEYEKALLYLTNIPENCTYFQEAQKTILNVYQMKIDGEGQKLLAKARAVWSAGMNAEAAAEAGMYLAEISEYSSAYKPGLALQNEIKTRIKSDIEYMRKLDTREFELEKNRIDAARQIGVAYGNHQQPVYYHDAYIR